MKDLPTSSDILEELATKAQTEIDKLAVSSFQTAIDEMIDFHKFLLDAYITEDRDHKKDFSFAQMGFWRPLHIEWITKYRNLFVRAIGIIGREEEFAQDFIRILMSGVLKLLPLKNEKFVTEVTIEIFDLYLIMAHHLQDWAVQNHIIIQAETPLDAVTWRSTKVLQKKYETILRVFIGSSEDLLRLIPSLYDWNKDDINNNINAWTYYKESWPLLQKHLRNTAYFLVIAVWNEDHIAARHYCDALIGWYKAIEHRLGYEDFLVPGDLLTPNLLNSNWNEVVEYFSPCLSHPQLEKHLNPENIFSLLIKNALKDTALIVVGVILSWFLNEKQKSHISLRISFELIKGLFVDEGRSGKIDIYNLFVCVIRILICDDHFSNEESYGGNLDRFIRRFDQLSERDVVPGRVYSPSTHYNRSELLQPWILILGALLPEEWTQNETTRILELTDKEKLFLSGDLSIRDLVDYLTKMKEEVSRTQPETVSKNFAEISTNKDFNRALLRTKEMLDDLLEGINSQRIARLSSRPIDLKKLQEIEDAAEKNAFDKECGNFPLYLFNQVIYSNNVLDEFTLSFKYSKGCLTTPPMDVEASNQKEVWSKALYDRLGAIITRDALIQADKQEVKAKTEEAYWREIKKFISEKRNSYILLVSSRVEPKWIFDLQKLSHTGQNKSISDSWNVWNSEEDKKKPGYLFHVNNIAVYYAPIGANHSFLIPEFFFKEVEFTIYANGKKIKADFESGLDDARYGTIKLTLARRVVVDHSTILELKY